MAGTSTPFTLDENDSAIQTGQNANSEGNEDISKYSTAETFRRTKVVGAVDQAAMQYLDDYSWHTVEINATGSSCSVTIESTSETIDTLSDDGTSPQGGTTGFKYGETFSDRHFISVVRLDASDDPDVITGAYGYDKLALFSGFFQDRLTLDTGNDVVGLNYVGMESALNDIKVTGVDEFCLNPSNTTRLGKESQIVNF